MTKQMYDDYIKSLKKKQKALIAVIIIISAVLIGMTIFAFSEFEITYESNDEYTYETTQTQSAEGDGDITLSQNSIEQPQEQSSNVYLICGTVIVCVLIVVIGLVVYGKSKSNANKKSDD